MFGGKTQSTLDRLCRPKHRFKLGTLLESAYYGFCVKGICRQKSGVAQMLRNLL